MGIRQYLREIGRGKDGARALTRAQAADLFGQVLDGAVSDLAVGSFCMAMRCKGETCDELAGFLDALHERMARVDARGLPVVVLPSYNGSRRLPLLTPLLALLLARRGLPVLVHGTPTEDSRLPLTDLLAPLGIETLAQARAPAPAEAVFVPTEVLHPGLKRLLDVRRTTGLRNPAHSVVKLMNPCAGPAVVVGSYTHPEYARSMGEVFERMGCTAMLLRGTEGEPVADARRQPRMEGFVRGQRSVLHEGERGTLPEVAGWPADNEAAATVRYIRQVLDGAQPVPPAIALQVDHLVRLAGAAA
ncbi:DNA-binding protein YbiB [Ramlibacter tataouinensis]|uniref:DNA-binding protein YbiB n=1 Tax=Ramlibacter tataouinensis TaxID=94132 RepID=UPI0022F3D536|nr:DNA-binding protein YbiB [Ramlibacter tataouinensis]WBY01456.1 DNA-binding protein YbiB [Ramlibacter tataouinensis]